MNKKYKKFFLGWLKRHNDKKDSLIFHLLGVDFSLDANLLGNLDAVWLQDQPASILTVLITSPEHIH